MMIKQIQLLVPHFLLPMLKDAMSWSAFSNGQNAR